MTLRGSKKLSHFKMQALALEPRSMLGMLIWEADDESFRRGVRF